MSLQVWHSSPLGDTEVGSSSQKNPLQYCLLVIKICTDMMKILHQRIHCSLTNGRCCRDPKRQAGILEESPGGVNCGEWLGAVVEGEL